MKSIVLISTFALFISSCSEKQEPTTESAASEAAVKPYPLDVCLVSGEKLGSMGDPTSLVHEGQEIKFCCDHCEPKFKKDPAKYLSQLEGK